MLYNCQAFLNYYARSPVSSALPNLPTSKVDPQEKMVVHGCRDAGSFFPSALAGSLS